MAAVTAAGPDDPIAAMKLATAAFLDVCTEPETARIMLIDAPAVLGGHGWSEAGNEDEMGLVMQPVMPLARILTGALREAVLYLASAPDPAAARDQVGAVLNGIIESVVAGGEQT